MFQRPLTPFHTLEGDVVAVPFHPRPVTEDDVMRGDAKPVGWYTSQGGKRYIVMYWPDSGRYIVYDEDGQPVDDYSTMSEEEAVRHVTEDLDLGAPAPAPARRYLLNGPVAARLRAILGR